MTKRQPNILIIMVDQLAPHFLSAHGHKVVKTPNLDRLFDSAVVFDSAYCNAPLCAPSRYVMMTGRLPTKIGAWDNAAELPAEVPTFAHRLSAQGYRTCLAGKMHFCGPDQLHGFEERLTTDVYPADFTWSPNWDEPERSLDWFHSMEVVRQAGPCLRSSYLDFDDEVTYTAKRYLFDLARSGETRPFCLVASYIHPHDPYINRPEYWGIYRDDEIDLPVVGRAAAPSDPHSERLLRAMKMDDPAPTEAQVRTARRAYYSSVSYLDARIGELLATLEEAGQAEDTVVIFTGDHGDMLGERGLWFKMSWFENSARVPLAVHWPKTFASRRVSQPVSLVDLLPTLAELGADGPPQDHPTALEGKSLVPLMTGDEESREAIGEYFGEGTDQPIFMIRRGAHKFVTCEGDPPQLYDVAADPHELNNLAGDGDQQSLAESFEAEAAARWDRSALRDQAIESQRRRRFLAPVLRMQASSWDYNPPSNAASSYIRNSVPIGELERRARFPAV